jgi:hypothetical protein
MYTSAEKNALRAERTVKNSCTKLTRPQVIKIAGLTILVTAAVAALSAYLITAKNQVG